MTRQNYYKRRNKRYKREIEQDCILSFVRQQRSMQPRLGGRKLLHLIKSDLQSCGVSIGRDRFYSFLKSQDLLIKRRVSRARTTYSDHGFRVYKNLLADAVLTGPNQALVSDITYIRTKRGFMYLALVMDAYSRAIVGYDCSDSLESRGVLRALSKALRQLCPDSRAIHHSDRGIQYCCKAYISKLKRKGLRISMTQVNHCYENGSAERLNGILKMEYGLGRTFLTKSDVLQTVSQAVRLYNYYRPHQSLGYRYPMEVHSAA